MNSGSFFFGAAQGCLLRAAQGCLLRAAQGCCLIAAIALSSPALATESGWDEEITIVGERFREKQATGAAPYIRRRLRAQA